MISAKWEKYILIASISVMVFGYNFSHLLWAKAYYHCMALGVLLAFTFIKSIAHNRKDISNIANVCFYLAVSNMADELFFDPTKFGENEYIFAVAIILWQWLLYKNKK